MTFEAGEADTAEAMLVVADVPDPEVTNSERCFEAEVEAVSLKLYNEKKSRKTFYRFIGKRTKK